MTQSEENLKPNGAPIASLMAAGIGSAVLGLLIVLTEMSPNIVKPAMTLHEGVGPLAGKTSFAVLAYFLSWITLHFMIGRKNVDEKRWLSVVAILIGAALVMSFPPFFEMFTKH